MALPPWQVRREGTGRPPIAVFTDEEMMEYRKRGYTVCGGWKFEKGYRPVEVKIVADGDKEQPAPKPPRLPSRYVHDPVAEANRKATEARQKAEADDRERHAAQNAATAAPKQEEDDLPELHQAVKRGRPAGKKAKKGGKKAVKKSQLAGDFGPEGICEDCKKPFQRKSQMQAYCPECLNKD